jgi:hypothetical protein
MTTLQLIKEAIGALKERTGSSVIAINKYIETEKKVRSAKGHAVRSFRWGKILRQDSMIVDATTRIGNRCRLYPITDLPNHSSLHSCTFCFSKLLPSFDSRRL